ncbi:MAG: hypothetical protein ACRDNB_00265 [Gaiellaceae bacterium]
MELLTSRSTKLATSAIAIVEVFRAVTIGAWPGEHTALADPPPQRTILVDVSPGA